jgi:hypothetical protein
LLPPLIMAKQGIHTGKAAVSPGITLTMRSEMSRHHPHSTHTDGHTRNAMATSRLR